MKFSPLLVNGAYLVEPEQLGDSRGFFARTFCQKEFAERGLTTGLVQCSVSFNERRGTLRGMHYQAPPNEEAKLIRCTMGAIYDVLLDLRPDSASYLKWVAIELTALNRLSLYVPTGVAHGFLTLQDNSEVYYQMSEFFHPESARGVRWNDRAFSISWPEKVLVISDRDKGYPDYSVISLRR